MEDGIGGTLVVNAIFDEATETVTLDKTWQQIFDADFAVVAVINEENSKSWVVPIEVYYSDSSYVVDLGNSRTLECDSADGYPSDN